MATDFNTNSIIATGSFKPNKNIPVDIRTVVETFDDISSIPNPFLGMQVFVKDSGELYLVKQIDEEINEYGDTEIFINISTNEDKERSLARIANADNINDLVGTITGESAGFGTVTASLVEDEGDTKVEVETDGENTAKNFSFKFYNLKGEKGDPGQPGDKGDKGDKGDAGDKGDSIVWKGELTEHPKNPQNGWAYYNTELGITFVYWGEWYKMSQDGEQGPQGEGAKVAIKGSFDSLNLMSAEWANYYSNPDGYVSEQYNSFITPLEPGDGYVVEENGHLYVFFTSVESFDNAWTDAGPIKGEDGDSAYLYIAYSNNSNGEGCWSIETDPTPGTYIGIKTSTEKLTDLKYTDYVWTLWQGDDGWGYEQVFLLTHKDSGYNELNGPNVPTDNDPVADYLPRHGLNTEDVQGDVTDSTRWSDRPLSVSEEWPLCWVVTRKAGKEYTPWKGTVDNKAILYSRWSRDGVDGTDGKDGSDGQDAIYLELSNDQAIIPFENGTVDADFTDPVTTQMTLYKGHNPVLEGVEYSIDNTTAASCVNGKVTLNLNNLSGVSVITCIATYDEKEYKKHFYIVKTANAYEIIPSHSILVRTDGKITSPSTLTAEVKKWNDTNWSNESNKVLFVQYFYLDGSNTVESIVNSNLARTINITKENLISIRLYVTVDNTKDGAVLSYESIGVIADGDNGKDGSTFKTAYAFRRTNDDLSSSVPTGGSWINPTPTNWNDSVPEGDQTLWMTLREFKFGDDNYGSWSTPRKMSDASNFQVEFSASEVKPVPQSLQSFYDADPDNYEENWRTSEKSAGREWLDHDEDASNAVWMATALFHNGVWDDWSVVKIKGEKGNPGEKGADGTSVTILGSLGDVSDLDGVYETSLTKGAGYLIDGYLWVFQGTTKPNEGDWYKDETHGVYWLNVGEIQGPAGVSAHLYVRCSNTEGNPKVLLGKEETGKYIGYLVSSEILTPEQLQEQSNLGNFTWTKWSGQDGWGYEQIYILSDSTYIYDKGPDIDDLESSATPDYRPTISDTEHCKGDEGKWSDTPMIPTAEYPYCWEAIRKVSGDGAGTVYGEWKGVVVDNRMCARLFDRYITDGKDSVYLELSNEFASAIVDDNGTVQNTVTINRILYKGGEEILDNEVTYSYESNAAFSVTEDGSEITVTTLNAEEVIIVCTAEYNGKLYKKNAVVRKSDTAWRVSSDTHVINKYYKDNELVISTGVVNFTVEKWDSSNWVDASKNVYLSYSLNGKSANRTITNKSFDFSTLDGDANNFKIYITDDNTSGGNVLDYEKLGIVIDGKDGTNGKDGDPGSDAYNFELTNDFGIVPLESNGTIDTQASAVQTSLVLIKGTTVLTKKDGVTYSSVPAADGSKISLNEDGLLTVRPAQYTDASEIPTEITCKATHGEVTLSKVFKIRTEKNAYELIVPKTMLQRDLTTGYLVKEDQSIIVQVQQWNAETNVWENPASLKSLCVVVDCVHLGETVDHSQAKVVSDGTAEIVLDKKDLKSVRLYLSTSNDVASARLNYLTYEDLGVYANGEDGYSQEYLYILSKTESTPINPTPSGYVDIESYQNSEWTPAKHFGWEEITNGQYTSTDGNGKYIKADMDPAWTDEPTGISTEYPYEYVSVRKKVNGIWGQFSTPVLWSAYGEKGDPGARSVTKFAFISSEPTPSISGGSYDFETNVFTVPDNWSETDSEVQHPIWMANRTFIEGVDTEWSTPIMISGENGKNGEDGGYIEYAYKRVTSEEDAPTSGPQYDIPEGESSKDGWYDNPQGVDSVNICEYVAIRYIMGTSSAPWGKPFLWSKYGVNGLDGDGVEYIYYVNDTGEAPANPTPDPKPDDYQNPEWTPEGTDWSDNPHGVSETQKYEYVSVRKKQNGTWGDFSDPKLWAKYGEKGETGGTGQTGETGKNAITVHVDNPIDYFTYNGEFWIDNSMACNIYTYDGITKVKPSITCDNDNFTITSEWDSGNSCYEVTVVNSQALHTQDGKYNIDLKVTYGDVTLTTTLTVIVKQAEYEKIQLYLENQNIYINVSDIDENWEFKTDVITPNNVTDLTLSLPDGSKGTMSLKDSINTLKLTYNDIEDAIDKFNSNSDVEVVAIPFWFTAEFTLRETSYKQENIYTSLFIRKGNNPELVISPNAYYDSTDEIKVVVYYKGIPQSPNNLTLYYYEKDSVANPSDGKKVTTRVTSDEGYDYFIISGEDIKNYEYITLYLQDLNSKVLDSQSIYRKLKGVDAVQYSIRVSPNEVKWLNSTDTSNNEYENVHVNIVKSTGNEESIVSGWLTEGLKVFRVICDKDGKLSTPIEFSEGSEFKISNITGKAYFYLCKSDVTAENARDNYLDYDVIDAIYTNDVYTARLTNPSTIIQIKDNEFQQTSVTTDAETFKNDEELSVLGVSITEIKIDGEPLDDWSSWNVTPGTSFTINGFETLEKRTQKVEIALNIHTEESDLVEILTVNVQNLDTYHLELSNDYDALICDNNGEVTDDTAFTNLGTRFTFFAGNADITNNVINNAKISIVANNCEYSNPGTNSPFYQITKVNADTATLTFTVTWEDASYEKVYTIKKLKNAPKLKLVLSKNIIKGEEEVNVKVWDGKKLIGRLDDNDVNILVDLVDKSSDYGEDGLTITCNKKTQIDLYYEGVLIDSETIGFIKDGENASYYQIDVNYSWIVKDKDGNVKTPDGNIIPKVYEINGNNRSEVDLTNLSDLGFRIDYIIDGDGETYTSYVEDNPYVDPNSITKQIVFYLVESGALESEDNTEWVDYVEVDVVNEIQGEKGDKGDKGDSGDSGINGPVVYPAGTWDANTSYAVYSDRVPYVYYPEDEKYYVLNVKIAEHENEGYEIIGTRHAPGTWYEPDETLYWIPMETYEAIYADIGVLKHALVGKWVFAGDYMFSQDGSSNGSSMTYEGALETFSNGLVYMIEEGEWTPNICFNAKTGETTYSGDGKIVIDNKDSYGSMTITESEINFYVSDVNRASFGNTPCSNTLIEAHYVTSSLTEGYTKPGCGNNATAVFSRQGRDKFDSHAIAVPYGNIMVGNNYANDYTLMESSGITTPSITTPVYTNAESFSIPGYRFGVLTESVTIRQADVEDGVMRLLCIGTSAALTCTSDGSTFINGQEVTETKNYSPGAGKVMEVWKYGGKLYINY